jgi:hypothetical protein
MRDGTVLGEGSFEVKQALDALGGPQGHRNPACLGYYHPA